MGYALGVRYTKRYTSFRSTAKSITCNNSNHNNIHHVQIFASIS